MTTRESFNEADVTFAQDMIQHHRQAVHMAAMAPDQAESEEVRQLAAGIQSAQGPEIKTMSRWLASWGEKVPEDTSSTQGMDHEGASMRDMPGMMTTQQMNGFMSATGAEFDQTFLTMMIAHHQGAIEMARTEQADGENKEAVDLAAQIQSHQAAEITTMRGLLRS